MRLTACVMAMRYDERATRGEEFQESREVVSAKRSAEETIDQ